MVAKPFWTSKTMWVNFLTIVAASLAILDPDLVPVDPRWLLFAAGFVNIVLRSLTNQPVSLTGSE